MELSNIFNSAWVILNAFSRRNKAIFEPIKASCEAHVSLSIQAAIAKYHRLGGGGGGLTTSRNILLTSWRLKVQAPDASMIMS